MICDVILTKKDNKYIARVREWPEVVAQEDTRDKAIQEIKAQLVEYLTEQIELIQIEIPVVDKTSNPWLEKFGYFKNDPTFDDLQAEMEAYRREIDQSTRWLKE
jgi:predicted RNase H-like HicB family nuclease